MRLKVLVSEALCCWARLRWSAGHADLGFRLGAQLPPLAKESHYNGAGEGTLGDDGIEDDAVSPDPAAAAGA
jgi:hypothetical protein